jgi:hypothetical protein
MSIKWHLCYDLLSGEVVDLPHLQYIFSFYLHLSCLRVIQVFVLSVCSWCLFSLFFLSYLICTIFVFMIYLLSLSPLLFDLYYLCVHDLSSLSLTFSPVRESSRYSYYIYGHDLSSLSLTFSPIRVPSRYSYYLYDLSLDVFMISLSLPLFYLSPIYSSALACSELVIFSCCGCCLLYYIYIYDEDRISGSSHWCTGWTSLLIQHLRDDW